MSYDLRIWGRIHADLATCLPTPRAWRLGGDQWTFGRRRWQLVASQPRPVEAEDAPREARRLCPELCVLVELSLEPSGAPRRAYRRLLRAAEELAAGLDGVIEDPQTATVSRPGEASLDMEALTDRFAIVELSWWYDSSPLLAQGGVGELLRILERTMPEAVPRRFGLSEPPRYKTSRRGVPALARFIADNLDNSPVLYTAPPVVAFSVRDDPASNAGAGFRANYLKLAVELDSLRDPKRESALRGLWRELSRFLQPFYGDVRVLRGWLRSDSGLYGDARSETHPVAGRHWRGVPAEPGLALVLGPPYLEHWTALPQAERDDALAFVEQPQWASAEALALTVPAGLTPRRREGNDRADERAELWPFAAPGGR